MRQMESDMLTNERNTFDITAEMTRQYKAMQENLMGKIGNLESEIHRLKDELGTRTRTYLEYASYQQAIIDRVTCSCCQNAVDRHSS
jgi:hypothetical protein